MRRKIRKGSYKDIDPTYELVIEYREHSYEHDGYCSDPENVQDSTRYFQKKYPLVQELSEELSGSHQLRTHDPLLIKYYFIEPEICELGSGYCGYETKYSIESAYLQKILTKTKACDYNF